MKRTLQVTQEKWQLKKPFIIARGARNETHTITVNLMETGYIGRGEAVSSPRYGENDQTVIADIEAVRSKLENGLTRQELQHVLPAGSARNAIDNALWDLEAKLSGRDVGTLSGLGWPKKVMTVQTVSILPPEQMEKEAALLKDFPIIKVKLNADQVKERIKAVHAGAPNSKLLVDANESWTIDILRDVAAHMADCGVVMIEQPLKAGDDDALSGYNGPLPIFADESCHARNDLPKLVGKYNGINIKLDKTGGLTEAIALMAEAKALGFDIMIGCMLGTSLGMAPALFLAPHASYVDVDAPALLAHDRRDGLSVRNGSVSALNKNLWGSPT